jgi:predicted NBD/HSP70 family sugar kinase
MGLGEARARYPETPSLLFVKVGTGIGAGVILHGQPERGIAGVAGDIGHIRLFDANTGHRYTCGAFGCLATEASGAAIARALRDEGGEEIESAADVSRLLRENDSRTLELTKRAGQLLGDVLATSVALLNPSVLVIGGGIAMHGTVLIDAVREHVYERTVPLATRELFIAPSALGSVAGLQGSEWAAVTAAPPTGRGRRRRTRTFAVRSLQPRHPVSSRCTR